jgi:hypothetical protein
MLERTARLIEMFDLSVFTKAEMAEWGAEAGSIYRFLYELANSPRLGFPWQERQKLLNEQVRAATHRQIKLERIDRAPASQLDRRISKRQPGEFARKARDARILHTARTHRVNSETWLAYQKRELQMVY